jgi:hypothetical protein
MNPSLSLAKHRTSRRRNEAGAVMFIVAMTTAVLASVGMYALAAASNEVRTSGNERQNTQTHYLSEYGVLGVTHEMVSSKAQFYLGLMMTSPDGVGSSNAPCMSLPGINPNTAAPVTRACRRMGSAELGQAWSGTITVPYAGTSPYQAGLTPGTFGPIPMSGDFFVELTEPLQAQAPARYATDLHFCFISMTATSNGITQPVIVGQPTGVYATEGIEVQRARIIAGPVQCPR